MGRVISMGVGEVTDLQRVLEILEQNARAFSDTAPTDDIAVIQGFKFIEEPEIKLEVVDRTPYYRRFEKRRW